MDFQKYQQAADYIKSKISAQPRVGIILGSGLGGLADEIAEPIVIPYSKIPNFAHSTAIGHKGNFISGTLGGVPVVAMQGRFHYYGHTAGAGDEAPRSRDPHRLQRCGRDQLELPRG